MNEVMHQRRDEERLRRELRCLLVYPAFRSASFWNFSEACRLVGAKYPAAPLGLMTVASLLPDGWDVRLLDRNVEPRESVLAEGFEWADLVLVGGMIAQQRDCLDVIEAGRARGKTVVCGGPDATTSPHLYREACHLVLGEAEVTLPAFLEDFAHGEAGPLYESEELADMTASPRPRWDLVSLRDYLYPAIQWSRGCPFNCEFCDIIEILGRVPRGKRVEQVLGELDRLYALGHRGQVDFVDDNFIGNQRAVTELLEAIVSWQREHGWPFEFSTEASLNLAQKPRLLGLLRDAGFTFLFVGIESPDAETLIGTQKRQNTCGEIARSVRTIQEHGMVVAAGYILGFDDEPERAAEGIARSVRETSIPLSMVGLLHALPRTQLTRRLQREGRLGTDYDVFGLDDAGDQCSAGLNFETKRPKSEILRDYIEVVETVYAPRAFFERVAGMAASLRCDGPPLRLGWRARGRELVAAARLALAASLRQPWGFWWWRTLASVALRSPRALRPALKTTAVYLHHGHFSQWLAERLRERVQREREIENGGGRPPGVKPRKAPERRIPSEQRA